MTASAPSNRTLLSLCLAAGLAGLSVAITGPILVDIARTHGVTSALAGQLMTIGSLAGMLGTLALSPLLDRIDRRTSLTLALADVAAAALLCALAPSFWLMALAYAAMGLGGYTLLALVLATAGDLYSEERLGAAVGWVVAGNVGVIVVGLPVVTALAEAVGWQWGFVFYALLASAVALFVRSSVPARIGAVRIESLSYVACFARAFRRPRVALILLTVALNHASIYAFGTYLGAAAIETLGATTGQMGPVFSIRFLASAVFGVLGGRYLRATDWRVTAGACVVCALMSVWTYAFAGSLALFTVLAVVHGATVGITDVGLNSLVVASDPGSRGSLAALRSVMDSLGGFVGPAMAGAVIAGSGYPAAGWLLAAIALGAAATIAAAARYRHVAAEAV